MSDLDKLLSGARDKRRDASNAASSLESQSTWFIGRLLEELAAKVKEANSKPGHREHIGAELDLMDGTHRSVKIVRLEPWPKAAMFVEHHGSHISVDQKLWTENDGITNIKNERFHYRLNGSNTVIAETESGIKFSEPADMALHILKPFYD